MRKKAGYTVDAPLVAIPNPDGSDRFCYKGDPVPADVDAALRDRLLERGLIKPTSSSKGNGGDGDGDGDEQS